MPLRSPLHGLVLLVLGCLIGRPAAACTVLFLKHDSQRLMAANMDWPSGDGIIAINKRGFFKTAVTDPQGSFEPARWTSRYCGADPDPAGIQGQGDAFFLV